MARGRPVVIVQVAFALAWIVAGPHVAFAQADHDRPSIGFGIPSINIFGVAKSAPISVDVGGKGISVALSGIQASGIVSTTTTTVRLANGELTAELTGANVSGVLLNTTQSGVSLSDKGLQADLSGVKVANSVAISGSAVVLSKEGLKAELPSLKVSTVLSISKSSINLDEKGLKAELAAVNIGDSISIPSTSVFVSEKGASVKLPDITVGDKSLWSLPVRDIINHISPATQAFAGMGSAEAFAPIELLLNGLAFGSDASPACASMAASDPGSLSAGDIWTWNAFSASRTDHDGYRVNTSAGTSCGSTLPFQTTQRVQLPGALWDASSAFGFKKGTFHMGFSGGATESDTLVKATASLRDAGIAQAGTTRTMSYSLGGFSLLTNDHWYAGSAFGGAWGRTQSQNFVLGSDSDHNTSTFVAAGFVGSIVSLTEMARFDIRGTLSYQRTVGEGHIDSLGLVYGDHTIEAADAIISGRLFGVLRTDGATIRPFIQADLTHHLRYSNELRLDGAGFSLQEADTSVFAAAGLDFEIDKSLQLSVGVRHDHSPDYENLTGRLGFLARFN